MENAWTQSPCAGLEDFASIRDELFAITPLESLEVLPFSLPHLMGQYLDPKSRSNDSPTLLNIAQEAIILHTFGVQVGRQGMGYLHSPQERVFNFCYRIAPGNSWTYSLLQVYSFSEVDRIWLWAYYNKVPICPIFYLLKGEYRRSYSHRDTCRGLSPDDWRDPPPPPPPFPPNHPQATLNPKP